MFDSLAQFILSFIGKKKKEFTTPKIPVVQCDHEFRKAIAHMTMDHRNFAGDMLEDRIRKEQIQRELSHKLIDELIQDHAIEFREEEMLGEFGHRFVAIIKYIR